MSLKSLSPLLFSIFILQINAYAGVFKCVKKNGDVYYNDKPCTSGLKERKVRLDKRPVKGVRSRKNKMPDKNPTGESGLLQNKMKQKYYSPADQAKLIKEREVAIREYELSIDDGSLGMSAEEKKIYREERKAEQSRKKALRLAEETERKLNKLVEEIDLAGRSRTFKNRKSKSEKRVSSYIAVMKNKEKSGILMTEEERNWGNLDKKELAEQALHYEKANTLGTKEYAEAQRKYDIPSRRKREQMKIDREFNNLRYR